MMLFSIPQDLFRCQNANWKKAEIRGFAAGLNTRVASKPLQHRILALVIWLNNHDLMKGEINAAPAVAQKSNPTSMQIVKGAEMESVINTLPTTAIGKMASSGKPASEYQRHVPAFNNRR